MALPENNPAIVTFSSVPNELKLLIADKLPISDVNALVCTSSAMNSLLTRYMYRRAIVEPSTCEKSFFSMALERCCLAATRIFLELGVDVNQRVRGTSLHLSCCWRQLDEYRFHQRLYNYGLTPLQVAMTAEGPFDHEPKIVRLLIDTGADISTCCAMSHTPLYTAVSDGFAQIAQLLLERGSDPYPFDHLHRTLLHLAVIRGHPAVVELLLRFGMDVQATDSFGWSPLHWAAKLGDGEIVKALLGSGANVLATDQFGNTPLLVAVHNRGIKFVAHCLIGLACQSDNWVRLQRIFATKGIVSAHWEHHESIPEYVDDFVVPSVDWRPNDRTVELLLEAGADIWAENIQHQSPILWAVIYIERNYS